MASTSDASEAALPTNLSTESSQDVSPGSKQAGSAAARKFSLPSSKSHQEYLDSLVIPSAEEIKRIATIQEQKEEEYEIKKRLSVEYPDLSDDEKIQAATVIQRSYRGHRARRQLRGLGVDATSRWMEAIKEARYRNLTTPRPRMSVDAATSTGQTPQTRERSLSTAKQNWKKVGLIARRAGWDEDPDDDSDEDDGSDPEGSHEERLRHRAEQRAKRQKAARIMDLQYFLEMVDLKHRYGSNLRVYHGEWKNSDTNENFFYWLDYGEGRFISCQACSRERLDRERVRYLSKEERLNYLVKIDSEGRLCWAKNDARIDTTTEFKDSIHGIVPINDSTPAFSGDATDTTEHEDASSESSEDDSDEATDEAPDREPELPDKYANPSFDDVRGVKKVKRVSAASLFDKLLRGSVKKNTWIFVADTSFRLYVGIKQSGAFQHSSFLHGSRISSAGLIKIKDGLITKLSPLSGHYRPPGELVCIQGSVLIY